MAYNYKQLDTIAYAGSFSLWRYNGSESREEMLVAGYFDGLLQPPTRNVVHQGDVLRCAQFGEKYIDISNGHVILKDVQ